MVLTISPCTVDFGLGLVEGEGLPNNTDTSHSARGRFAFVHFTRPARGLQLIQRKQRLHTNITFNRL